MNASCHDKGVTWHMKTWRMHASRHRCMSHVTKQWMKESCFRFVNRMYHPNVDELSGSVCLDVINQSWSPMFGILFFVFFNLFTKVLNSYKPYSYTSRVPYYCEFDQSTRPVFHITSNRRSCILLQVEVQKAISLNLILKGTMLAVCYSVLQCAAPRCHQPILESKVCYTFFYRPLFHKQVLHP